MNQRLQAISTFFLIAFTTSIANATNVNWSSAVPFTVNAGVESPLVLFGFNPQPEPPPSGLVTNSFFDPAAATLELSGIEPTPFLFFTAAKGGSFAFPPEPIMDFDSLTIPFTTSGGSRLSFLFSLSPGGDGDASSGISDPLFFNPQPEPPPGFDDSIGFLFAFNDLSGVDTVQLSLQVLDDSGQALGLSPVPVPAAAWLFGTALIALTGIGKRRKAARLEAGN
jgi:hypothetical protein